MSEGQEDGAWKELNKSGFVELVNLDFGKYKNVSHYGFNAVCKEKQYDRICGNGTFKSICSADYTTSDEFLFRYQTPGTEKEGG